MKKLVLLSALVCATVPMYAGSIDETLREINNNRLTSAAKSIVCFLGGISAAEHSTRALFGWHHFKHHSRDHFFGSLADCIAEFGADHKQRTIEHGVMGFGMAYVAYKLFGWAYKYGQHAFEGKQSR